MSCTPSPFPIHVLAEANERAPGRRKTSDGICADQRHIDQGTSDHIPDARGIPHAVDVSVDPGVFDPRDYLAAIVARRDPRLTYIVANFSGWHGQPNDLYDQILDFAEGDIAWRQNGDPKRDHAESPHVHFSFTDAAENSTAPFFVITQPPHVSDEVDDMVIYQPNKKYVAPARPPIASLDIANRHVILLGGATVVEPTIAVYGARVIAVPTQHQILGWAEKPDGFAVVTIADEEYHYHWKA